VKIATWNVNSLRAREDLVLDWLEANEPDALCMQETKVTDQEFPEDGFGDLDYEVVFHGQSNYNGVAIAVRGDEPADVRKGFDGDGDDSDRRVIAARVEDIHLVNIYLPNGQAVDGDKYAYKLEWMKELRAFLDAHFDPRAPVVLCGDFNIAPSDLDHHWPASDRRRLFTTPEERAAYAHIVDFGFVDAFRALYPDARAYTWWDYRGRTFQRDEGMRIDHLLITPAVRERLEDVTVDRAMRAADGPSDHVPVLLHLA
jgi:exodeoxyribonuclease-3